MLDKERIEGMIDALSTGIKDNTVNVSALVELLVDKKMITMKEYQKFRMQEDAKMDAMIEKAMNELQELIKREDKKSILDHDEDKIQSEIDEILKQYGGKLGSAGDA